MGSGCIFCAIVAGDAPSRRVYEDERTLAFLDIVPLTRGHALVVPKRHATNLFEIDDDDLAAVAATAKRVGAAAMEAFGADGLNLLQTNGAVAMQTVFHLHVHVLPRYVGDGFKVELVREPAEASVLDAVAAGYGRVL